MIQPSMGVSMTANVHSMVPHTLDLVHRHVQFAGESRLVDSHVFGEQPSHNFNPYRLGQLALEQTFERSYLPGVVAMLPGHGHEISFLGLESMLRAKLRK